MSQLTFDTLEYVRTLENGGIPKEQAEAITAAQKKAFSEMVTAKDLATKMDLIELEMRLEAKMGALKTDLIKWLVGGFIAQTALLVAILAWVFPH